jgi:two-component system, OmpR family, response regulator
MMEQAHILVVDDDREIRDLVARYLGSHGLRVRTAADGRQMQREIGDWSFDLIILDLMLPGEDGLSLCRRLRVETAIPVIMLTAMGEETDRIIGLEMGADDYIAKPFNPRELLARIKAVLRRTATTDNAQLAPKGRAARYVFAGWKLDMKTRELISPNALLIPLSGGEYDLLAAFVTHSQRILSRDQLLDLARGREAQPFDRSIDVQVSRLRRKIEEDPANPTLIKTVRSGGYMFTPDVECAK